MDKKKIVIFFFSILLFKGSLRERKFPTNINTSNPTAVSVTLCIYSRRAFDSF